MAKRYYQMDQTDDSADIVIFGDITSWPWMESDVSSWNLSKQLMVLPETVSNVNVHINSYGGEVAEGLAIYNALKAHPAKVTTYCEGFACSIASVIFMAGDDRVMDEASLLMIHNASGGVWGTADEMRKSADDMDTVTNQSKKIYLAVSNLSDDDLKTMMDAETFLEAQDALAHGFATEVRPIDGNGLTQDARKTVADRLTHEKQAVANLKMSIPTRDVLQSIVASLQSKIEEIDQPESGKDDEPPEPEETPLEEPETEDIEHDEPNQRLVSFFQAIQPKKEN